MGLFKLLSFLDSYLIYLILRNMEQYGKLKLQKSLSDFNCDKFKP